MDGTLINATSLSEANAILELQGHTMRLSRIGSSPSLFYALCERCKLAGEWMPYPPKDWPHGNLHGPATRNQCEAPSTNGET